MGFIGFNDRRDRYDAMVKFLQHYGRKKHGETISISNVLRSCLELAISDPQRIKFETEFQDES